MSIRSFSAADVPSVQRLIHDTIDACYAGVYPPRAVGFFKEFHSLDRIRERGATGETLVVEERGVLVATGTVVGNEITGVFVHPGAQGRGVGGRVMDRLEAIARIGGHSSVHLDVSLPSRGFYERRGYRVLESRSIDVGAGESLEYWAAQKILGEGAPGGRIQPTG